MAMQHLPRSSQESAQDEACPHLETHAMNSFSRASKAPLPLPKIDALDDVMLAASLMKAEKVGALAVTRNGKIIGMITGRDIVKGVVAEGLDPRTTAVEAIVTQDVFRTHVDTGTTHALMHMFDNRTRHLLLEGDDAEGESVTMVSRDEILLAELNIQLERNARLQRALEQLQSTQARPTIQ